MTRYPRWTITLCASALFMVAMDALVVATALPAIQRDLHAGLSTLEWTVNAYNLTYAAGIISAAVLGDRLGRRRVFVIGLALFTCASAACALAPTPGLLLAARATQGIGAAAVMPLSLTILTSAFPPERRGAVVGVWGAIGGLAVASGPVIGGAITQGIDWHWIFWVNVPVGGLAIAGSLLRLPGGGGRRSRLDLPGLALSGSAAVLLVWALVRAGQSGWSNASVLLALAGGIVLLAVLVAWERRAPEPMLPPRLFVQRSFTAANAGAFMMTAGVMGAAFLISQYFQFALGLTPLATGLRLLPWTATPIVVAPLAGSLSDRVGPRPLMASGLLLEALGLAGFALLAAGGHGYPVLVAPLVVAGIGISMALPTTASAALGAVRAADVGTASGVNSTMQRFGGAFGVAIATAVFAAHGRLGSPASFTSGFRPALVAVAGLSLVGALAAAGIRPGVSRPLPEPAAA